MDSNTVASIPWSDKAEDSNNTKSPAEVSRERYENGIPRQGRFRFKKFSPSQSRPLHDESGREGYGSDRHRHHHHHHHRHRRHHSEHHRSSKRRKTTRSSPTPYSSDYPPLSPGAAFRESLFDALGDDEGADFWESVYGQPIHTYAVPSVPKGPNGELERMSDEEYAAYVRTRMWEKTHEGIMEERDRRRKERVRENERLGRRQREAKEERLRFERALEESLKRGGERRRTKAWVAVWEKYQRSWEELNALIAMDTDREEKEKKGSSPQVRNHLFWPVESGKRRDISPQAVEEFMRHASPPPASESQRSDQDRPSHFLATLKTERVRWHPDKIQHRYSVLGIDEAVIHSVTEVFQILDRLWSEERDPQKRKKE
jgi:hypothetical protein